MTKVIVVGAGLAGLCAAVRLAAAGCEVVVLEGRDEIGGRSRSRLVEGTVVELGGQFLSRTHRRMRELVADAALHLRRARLWAGTARLRREDAVNGQLMSVGALRDLRAFVRIALGSKSLAVVRRAATGDDGASAQDARSVREWLDDIALSGPLRPAAETLIGEIFGGADPGDISLLAFAELVGSAGNGFLFLLDGFGNTDYIVEGVGTLCAHLARRIPTEVQLQASVSAVEHDGRGAAARTVGGEVVEGDHVVLAIPTPILETIAFTPHLPQPISDANDAIRYGQATKVAAVLRRRGMLKVTGFLGGSAVRQGWRVGNVLYGFAGPDVTDVDLSRLTEDLCDGFGVNPLDVAHTELMTWAQDPLTRGTYAHFRPGGFSGFRRSLPHYSGRLHLAGSERSTRPGFMEGAVESGEAAASAILATS
jgi:monoamine oxidase